MLASAEAIHVVADAFRRHDISVSVVDPVIPSSFPLVPY
jgi:hydroxymethylpyrimidine/phosphomethylpyrimidine kinase